MFLLTRYQAIHTQLSDSSNNLSFSSRVYHRLSFLSRLFPPQYTYIYPPPTRSSIPCFSSSVYPPRTDPRHSMAAFHSSHVLSHARLAMQRACTPSSPRIYPGGSQGRGERKAYRNVFLVRVLTFFLSPVICLCRRRLPTGQVFGDCQSQEGVSRLSSGRCRGYAYTAHMGDC